MVTPKVLEAPLKFGNMTVYTGYVVVTVNGKYSYSEFSNITRLYYEEALQDAKKLKMEL